MNRWFLGKWWHWAIIVFGVMLLWLAGNAKMHVIQFNLFVSLILVGTAVVVVCVVRCTSPGEQVTRDPIEDDS